MGRKLSEAETSVIRFVAENLPAERKRQLLDDLECVSVADATPDNSVITFDIAGYKRPLQSGQRSFGVDGKLLDMDGAQLSFDLYADENYRLFILEIIRWDGENVIKPNWSTLKIYGLPGEGLR